MVLDFLPATSRRPALRIIVLVFDETSYYLALGIHFPSPDNRFRGYSFVRSEPASNSVHPAIRNTFGLSDLTWMRFHQLPQRIDPFSMKGRLLVNARDIVVILIENVDEVFRIWTQPRFCDVSLPSPSHTS
jgi:hypothetical protein